MVTLNPWGYRLRTTSLILLLLFSLAAGTPDFEDMASQLLFREPNHYLSELAKLSDTEGSLARTYMSPAHKSAAAQLKTWMEAAGMDTWVDAVGNVHGKVSGTKPDAPAILVGSHYDTVLDGGNYDGQLGIIVGISAVKALLVRAALNKGVAVPAATPQGYVVLTQDVVQAASKAITTPIHLVAFADEEGVRFQSTFLGSRALAGTLIKHGMLKAKDKAGHSLADVLASDAGVTGDVAEAVAAIALKPDAVQEYVELHIEQGPVLEARGLPLGVVSAIAGQTRLWVVINGTQGHAGTVPMRGRGDSLTAAAEVVSVVERRCGGGPEGGKAGAEGVMEFPSDEQLVCTVGELRVWPGASNVIPGQVQMSVDIRAKADTLRSMVVANVTASIYAVCAARGVSCEVQRTHDAPAVLSDARIVERMVASISASRPLLKAALKGVECGTTQGSTGHETCASAPASLSMASEGTDIPVMVSGAGHDAMAIADIAKMGMMFVRCRGGVSHSPLEHAEPADVAAATAALTAYLEAAQA